MTKALAAPNALLVVGQRIHCILYGGRAGIVYEIRGEQTPESVKSLGRGCVVMGGSATFMIAFEDGTWTGIPESIIRGVQWRIYDEVATADEITEALQFVEAEKLRRETEETLRAQAKAARREQAIQDYPHLQRAGGKTSSHSLGAKNIKRELARQFPGIKFSVKSDSYSGGDSITVAWSLGPTTDEVQAITGKFREGQFDGMQDIYEYDRENVFPDLFGGALYVSCSREDKPGHDLVARDLCAFYKIPVPENGQFWRLTIPNLGEDVACLARQIILAQSFPPGAVITGASHIDGLGAATYAREFWQVTFTAPETVASALATGDQGDARTGELALDLPAVTVTENEARDGVEIRFAAIPPEPIRASLKANGFRWSRHGGCWYKKRSPQSLEFARSFVATRQ